MKWQAEVCFLQLDVDKAREVDGNIPISVRCNEAACECFERRAVELIKEDPYAERYVI